jgi:hypothetical protein
MRYGLGAGQMVDGVYVMDTPITTDTVSSSGQNVYTDSLGQVIFPSGSPGSLTDWFNQNSTMVMLGAGAFLALILVAKAGR